MTNLTDTRTSDVEEVDVAIINLLFAGLSIAQMEKIPKWLLENIENNKSDFKQALTSFREKSIAEERERIVVLAQVYAVLFAECGAKLDEMSRFIATMDTEYRFQGFLGFGGKVYKRNDGSFYVDCYSEDRTSERQAIIDVANRRLSALTPPKETNK